MFRGSSAARRWIVPAGLFYGWQKVGKAKQPYAIARADEAPLAFGGVWEGWRSPEGEFLRTFVIIITGANREMAALHDRMPLVLEEPDWRLWLGEDAGDAAGLLRPAPDGTSQGPILYGPLRIQLPPLSPLSPAEPTVTALHDTLTDGYGDLCRLVRQWA